MRAWRNGGRGATEVVRSPGHLQQRPRLGATRLARQIAQSRALRQERHLCQHLQRVGGVAFGGVSQCRRLARPSRPAPSLRWPRAVVHRCLGGGWCVALRGPRRVAASGSSVPTPIRASMVLRIGGESCEARPKARPTARTVTSSQVGPTPPEVSTRSYLTERALISSAISSRSSPTMETRLRWNVMVEVM